MLFSTTVDTRHIGYYRWLLQSWIHAGIVVVNVNMASTLLNCCSQALKYCYAATLFFSLQASYADLLTVNSSQTEFLLTELKQQLSKIHNSSLTTIHSARNLGFIFDEHLTFSKQITALSKSCHYHIRELLCIHPYLHFKTASTTATSIVHSKLDYCNSIITFQTVNLTSSNRFKTLLLMLLFRSPILKSS